MKVRLDSGWLQHLDERLLEYIVTEGGSRAWVIASDLDVRQVRVARRCRVLAEAEFLECERRKEFADRWDITSWGLLYLAGELDADLRRPLPGPRPGGRIRPAWYAGFESATG